MLRHRPVITVVSLTLAIVAGFGCEGSSPQTKVAKHKERASNYFASGQYSEALIEYKNAAQIDPNDAEAQYRLALVYLKLGGPSNLQQAFAALSQSVLLDKDNVDAQMKLGELHLLGRNTVKAR